MGSSGTLQGSLNLSKCHLGRRAQLIDGCAIASPLSHALQYGSYEAGDSYRINRPRNSLRLKITSQDRFNTLNV